MNELGSKINCYVFYLAPHPIKVAMYVGEKEDNGIEKWIDKVN